MKAEVQYLHHSGFSVRTEGHFFVFDYDGSPADFEPPREGHVAVFVSHRHGDHFSPAIFDWKRKNPSLELVLSDDVRPAEGCRRIGPGGTLSFDGVAVRALRSTDEGVAFLVEADGLSVYHAGDLNWWHWNGESAAYNRAMKRDYCAEIDKLRGVPVDLAFLPLDPRLEDAMTFGVDAFARAIGPKAIFPMHLWDRYGVIDALKADPAAASYADTVVRIERPGQVFSFSF